MAYKILYNAQFESEICSHCGICNEHNASSSWCMAMFNINKEKFLENVVKCGKILNSDKKARISKSLELFEEIICNEKACPVFAGKCNIPGSKILCYEYWANKKDLLCEKEVNAFVYGYQEIKNDKIECIYNMLPKKKKKKIRKDINKLIKIFCSNNAKKLKIKNKKHSVVATVFYRNDDAWIKHLNKIFNKNT